ncbi:MAG: 50S ribosomal protein L18e [Candidatus Micrarchaeia archaeon]
MKSNVERGDIRALVAVLEGNIASRKKVGLSKKLLKLVDVPARERKDADIYKINKYTSENDSVIVPGKVLAEGSLNHKISIAALGYSKKAKEELERSGSKIAKFEELMEEKKVKIIV